MKSWWLLNHPAQVAYTELGAQVISIKIPFTSWWAGGQGLQYGTGIISVAGVRSALLCTQQPACLQ